MAGKSKKAAPKPQSKPQAPPLPPADTIAVKRCEIEAVRAALADLQASNRRLLESAVRVPGQVPQGAGRVHTAPIQQRIVSGIRKNLSGPDPQPRTEHQSMRQREFVLATVAGMVASLFRNSGEMDATIHTLNDVYGPDEVDGSKRYPDPEDIGEEDALEVFAFALLQRGLISSDALRFAFTK